MTRPSPVHAAASAALWVALAAAPLPALGADEAGAEALRADFEAFFADLEETYGLAIAPAAPVRVEAKGDDYLVEIAPLTVAGSGAGAGAVTLALARTSLRLTPDATDPDRTTYDVMLPALTLTLGEGEAIDLSFDAARSTGIWSDALDLSIEDHTRIEGLRLAFDTGTIQFAGPPFAGGPFTGTAGLIESEHVAVAETAGLWVLRSRFSATDSVFTRPRDARDEPGAGPGPEAATVLISRTAAVTSESRLTGVPLAAWGAYLKTWLPALVAAERTGEPLDRDQLASLVQDLPALFATATMSSTTIDTQRYGLAIAESHDALELRTDRDGALDLTSRSTATGISYDADGTSAEAAFPLPAVAAGLVPTSYSSHLEAHDLPVTHSWDELTGTIDAWIDSPDAALDIVLRSFDSRARALGTAAALDLEVDWPSARFALSATFAASRQAALGVAGVVDGAFTNMEALTEAFVDLDMPEIASGLLVLQTLGQREQPAGGGDAVTRYRLEIAQDGQVTFNMRDFGPVLRMVEQFFDSFPLGPDAPAPPRE